MSLFMLKPNIPIYQIIIYQHGTNNLTKQWVSSAFYDHLCVLCADMSDNLPDRHAEVHEKYYSYIDNHIFIYSGSCQSVKMELYVSQYHK